MYEIPRINLDIPALKSVVLSVSELKAMSDAELLAVLNGESSRKGIVSLQLQQIITSELFRRNLVRTSKPHWSMTPSFWLLIISTTAACIAAYPVIFLQPQVQQSLVVNVPTVQAIQPAGIKPSKLPQPSLKENVKKSSH